MYLNSCLMGLVICRTGWNVSGVRVVTTGASKKIEGEQDGAGCDPALIWRFRRAPEEFLFPGSVNTGAGGDWSGGDGSSSLLSAAGVVFRFSLSLSILT